MRPRPPRAFASRLPPPLTDGDRAFARALVRHEDASLMILDKPPGLAVQGGSGVDRDLDTLLWAFATRKGRRPKLVHRLDRDTSGVMVVAKTQPAAAALSEQFASRGPQKTYHAIVSGTDPLPECCDVALVRFKRDGIDLVRPAAVGEDGAMQAATRFTSLSTAGSAALVEARPETGRMHQIRAHLAHCGRPIAGDAKYGGLLVMGGGPVRRAMLHASRLEFLHPETGARVMFEALPPEDFEALAQALSLKK